MIKRLKAIIKIIVVLSYSGYKLIDLLITQSLYPNDPLRIASVPRQWGRRLCSILGIHIHMEGEPLSAKPCLLVANHMGFLDPVVWLAEFNVAFVAKKEVADWPIFGRGARAIGVIFVDRKSPQSRMQTSQTLAHKIRGEGRNIVIFPEGTSSIAGKPWKRGSLQMAHEQQVPVQAARVFFNPVRECSYVDDDYFFPQLWDLAQYSKIEVRIQLFSPVLIKDVTQDAQKFQELVQQSQARCLADVGYVV